MAQWNTHLLQMFLIHFKNSFQVFNTIVKEYLAVPTSHARGGTLQKFIDLIDSCLNGFILLLQRFHEIVLHFLWLLLLFIIRYII